MGNHPRKCITIFAAEAYQWMAIKSIQANAPRSRYDDRYRPDGSSRCRVRATAFRNAVSQRRLHLTVWYGPTPKHPVDRSSQETVIRDRARLRPSDPDSVSAQSSKGPISGLRQGPLECEIFRSNHEHLLHMTPRNILFHIENPSSPSSARRKAVRRREGHRCSSSALSRPRTHSSATGCAFTTWSPPVRSASGRPSASRRSSCLSRRRAHSTGRPPPASRWRR